jgi:hypothetical protein
MRTSLNETAWIEHHLLKQADTGEALLFDAKLILDSELSEKARFQQHAYKLIEQYGRNQLKQEIDIVHQQIFTDEAHQSFRQKIARIFFNK